MDQKQDLQLTKTESYRLWTQVPIRFCDTDAMGHVSNVAYAAYLEAARFQVFSRIFGDGPDLSSYAILARLELDYRREVNFPGDLDVGSCLVAIGTKSFELGHGIFKNGECVATATTVMVSFDYETRQSVPIPDAVRKELLAL
ncbi:MAG TPA: thioesterase family protein [Kiloniellaceae bacterium]|nr:thioesterase family protein [Kiloniellaceae bacterium]